MTATANHFGNLKFLKPETQSSLFRNDLVRMVRDHRGNFVESHGVATESHELRSPMPDNWRRQRAWTCKGMVSNWSMRQ